jgi:pimeloyl-ACP methyl ester carboxylesterase
MKITKHFVTVGQRRVHYLRAGQGPSVAMLHASPCSSKVMRPLMDIFAQQFTCFAFDTPGFGLSDPLPIDSPSVEDFADALADTLGALGIAQVATYGRHTGASIAVEFAARHPERCSMALADGFAVFAKAYSPKELDLYLEPIVPQWDGAHILHLWFRYRDQHVFWPWNKQFDANRSDTDVPDLDFLHRGVVELLQAGDGYRVGYAAPFRHRALGVVPDLKVPVCFGVRPGDSMFLTRHLYPADVWMSEAPRDFEAAAVHEMALLALHPAPSVVPQPQPCQALPQRLTEAYVDFEGAQLAVRSFGSLGSATPVLLLHPAPGSSRLYEAAMMAIGAQHPVLALDLPGHGESDPLPLNPQDHATWMRAVCHVLDHLGVKQVHLWGHQGGAALACAMAVQCPERVTSVTLDAPLWTDAPMREQMLRQGIPDVNPSWEGAHWLRAWHHTRDAELWWPWFDRRVVQRKPQPSQIDPVRLNLRVLEAMKQPASYAPAWRVNWSFDWLDQLPRVQVPLLCTTADSDTYAHLSLNPPSPLKASTPVPSAQHLNVLCQWWQKNAR